MSIAMRTAASIAVAVLVSGCRPDNPGPSEEDRADTTVRVERFLDGVRESFPFMPVVLEMPDNEMATPMAGMVLEPGGQHQVGSCRIVGTTPTFVAGMVDGVKAFAGQRFGTLDADVLRTLAVESVLVHEVGHCLLQLGDPSEDAVGPKEFPRAYWGELVGDTFMLLALRRDGVPEKEGAAFRSYIAAYRLADFGHGRLTHWSWPGIRAVMDLPASEIPGDHLSAFNKAVEIARAVVPDVGERRDLKHALCAALESWAPDSDAIPLVQADSPTAPALVRETAAAIREFVPADGQWGRERHQLRMTWAKTARNGFCQAYRVHGVSMKSSWPVGPLQP